MVWSEGRVYDLNSNWAASTLVGDSKDIVVSSSKRGRVSNIFLKIFII